jgi:hypothetical protein
MNVQTALKGQYHAALGMLKQCIEQCPDDLWAGGAYPVPFWRVAYHTLYYTHLYLQQNEEGFRYWEHHRDGYQSLPRPPDGEREGILARAIDGPFTKAQILDYWRFCDAMIDAGVDRLDLEAQESGFPWHKTIPKLEHQIHNIRHIQHHAALLAGRLRLANGTDVRWVRSVKQNVADVYDDK